VFGYAFAAREFEIVDLPGHRDLADAEALAGDRHLTAEAIVSIAPHAGAARIGARRHQPEAGRAGALSTARAAAVASDGDLRARQSGGRRDVDNASAALDM